MSQDEVNGNDGSEVKRRKRRWGDAAPADAAPAPATTTNKGPIDSKAKALALKESIAARLAALKAKTGAVPTKPVTATTAGVKRPASAAAASDRGSSGAATASSNKRAKHYELDMAVTGPTFNKAKEPPKPKVNPYLAHHQTKDVETNICFEIPYQHILVVTARLMDSNIFPISPDISKTIHDFSSVTFFKRSLNKKCGATGMLLVK